MPGPMLRKSTKAHGERVKYLGLILDGGLTWKPDIEARVRKATSTLYACRGAIGKRWGLFPKGTFWLYNTIIINFLYGVLVAFKG